MKCSTLECVNEAAPGRKVCHTCRSRAYRQRYPLKYAYATLRMNAMRRGKPFELTLTEFETFCKHTGYDQLKGKTATSLTVDRIKNELGYTADNIRAITLSDNVKTYYDETLIPEEWCPF